MTNYGAFAQNPTDRDEIRNTLDLSAIRSFLSTPQPVRGSRGGFGALVARLLH